MIQRPPPSPVLAYPVAIPPAKLYASRSRRKTHPIKNSSRRRVCNRASKPASPHYIHPSQKIQSLLWDNPQVVPLLYKPHRWAPRGAPGGRWKRKCRLCKNFFENILPCPCQCALLDSAQYATAKDAASPSLTRVQQIPGRVDDNIPFYEDFSPLAQPSYPSHTTSATGPLFLLIAVVALPVHFLVKRLRCDVCGACVVEASLVPCSAFTAHSPPPSR